jgi:hypothetical protein
MLVLGDLSFLVNSRGDRSRLAWAARDSVKQPGLWMVHRQVSPTKSSMRHSSVTASLQVSKDHIAVVGGSRIPHI